MSLPLLGEDIRGSLIGFKTQSEDINDTSDPCEVTCWLRIRRTTPLVYRLQNFAGLQFINSAAQFPLRNDPVRELAKQQMACRTKPVARNRQERRLCGDLKQLSKQLLLLLEGSLSVRFVQGDNTAAHTARKLAELAIKDMFYALTIAA